ncbi:protein kinase domain-containing protein [Candidatus Berkiella aquae]|uniref:Protein kinase n=1 Tax=Candidatus Berkiella aquae TaxID=295108 RepID=A0A0Q9YRK3_9GAMM|nr:protein kinase [Candidatus Berkiella aquae]MCS5709858.1 protein kinase [Candidatus Berkiella aquae]
MARVHPKIAHKEAQKVINNESLLSDADRELVEEVRKQISDFQKTVTPTLEDLNATQQESLEIGQQLQNANFILSAVSEQRSDLADDYKPVDAVLTTIEEYIESGDLNLGNNVKTINDLIRYFGLTADNLNSNHNKLQLVERLTTLETEKQTQYEKIQEKHDQLEETSRELEEKINTYHEQLAQLETTLGVKCDVNNKFELTKISKGAKGPEFSVIFANTENGTKPFILYRGKEYEGKVRQLGAGGFGKVKLGQDYETNELVAIKVQIASNLPESVLAKEKAMLQQVGHLKGDLLRTTNQKDYIVQELHYGKELESIIKGGELSDLEALVLLNQAAAELQILHDKDLIHRDIKLENFIWDSEMSKCVLIDLAFIEKVDGDEVLRMRDEAGSQSYLSPEALEGNYSKRSDIFALGTMMNEILENHPNIHALLKDEINSLTNPNVNERAKSLHNVINKINVVHQELTKPTVASTNRPAPITTQLHESKSREKQERQNEQETKPKHDVAISRHPSNNKR